MTRPALPIRVLIFRLTQHRLSFATTPHKKLVMFHIPIPVLPSPQLRLPPLLPQQNIENRQITSIGRPLGPEHTS